jgi:hypothetical protein
MSQQPEHLVWPGGEHDFLLAAIGQLKALEQSRDSGPLEIYVRIVNGSYRADDITETIRLGLIGGGMDKDEARKLVISSLDRASINSLRPLAISILNNTLFWDGKGDEPGEAQAGEATSPSRTRSPTAEPDGQPTTQPAQ